MEHFELNLKEKWFIVLGEKTAINGSSGKEGEYFASG
jgi:hypothetical protein